jgi:hypothetical protein
MGDMLTSGASIQPSYLKNVNVHHRKSLPVLTLRSLTWRQNKPETQAAEVDTKGRSRQNNSVASL